MSEDRYQHTQNGQEVQEADLNLLGKTGALMDDRLLAEFLRVAPYNGTTVTKAVVPYSYFGAGSGNTATPFNPATVAPTGSANGSIVVNPFRAIVGSRTALATNSEKDNWRDIRSAVFVNAGSGSLSLTQALAANASGNARIDLVYCAFAVDQNANSVTRKVKAPAGTSVTATSVFQTLSQLLTVAVVTGTPGASPATPSLPADTASTYYIPLAYVRVPNGFSAASTVATTDIIEAMPFVQPHSSMGLGMSAWSPINTRINGTAFTAAAVATWANTGTRPSHVASPEFGSGMVTRLIAVDITVLTNGMIVDDTIDWRNRLIKWFVFANSSAAHTWAYAHGAGVSAVLPVATTGLSGADHQDGWGQSFVADAALVASSATILQVTPTNLSAMGASSTIGLYTLLADGRLVLYLNGSPAVNVMVMVIATPQFSNE